MKINRKTILGLLLIAMLLIVGCTGEKEDLSGEVIAQVGDATVISGDVAQYLPLFLMLQGVSPDDERLETYKEYYTQMAIDDLVTMELIKNYYEKTNKDVLPADFESKLKATVENSFSDEQSKTFLLNNNITEEFLKKYYTYGYYTEAFYDYVINSIGETEEASKLYYHENISNYEEVRASHILVETIDEANELIKKINAGADFENLAIEYSIEPAAKTSKGDLGFFGKGKMVKEFEEAVFNMEVGSTSDPVKTQFGYHVIKVVDKKVFAYEEVAEDVYSDLLDKAYEKELDIIRQSVEIKFN